ncbi:hypothetical protein TRIUR3_00472 [Triticum urartu]|uniref:Uncharacterized protein n=1 Tax=Triticum urartu TaxID=4572 RepID=M8A0I6_TRIUA|nr:hypothetical protein TRIUR3_00472 [Triticum urartu]
MRPHGHGDRAAPRHGLSAQEHRATTTRATASASKTLTPPHPRPAATPTKKTSGKVPPFVPLGDPQRRDPTGRPELASTDPSCYPECETSSVLQHREGDEVSPAAPCARRAQSCGIGRGTRLVPLHRARDELGSAAPGVRQAVDHNWERTSPLMGIAPGRRGDGEGRDETVDQ